MKFNPDEDKQAEFVAGCSDKKIVQYDTRSGDVRTERPHFTFQGCMHAYCGLPSGLLSQPVIFSSRPLS